MIYLYDGTPGSGKTFHAVKDIMQKLGKKTCNNVIANFDIVTDSENFHYWATSDFSVGALERFHFRKHVPNKENQTLIVIDEAYTLFNARDWNSNRGNKGSSRADWVEFMAKHRHYYYNIILIVQSDIMIDKQIRRMIEIEVAHFAANNFIWFLPLKCFLYVERWYAQRKKLRQGFMLFKKRIAKRYDTFALFERQPLQSVAESQGDEGGDSRPDGRLASGNARA